MTGRPSGTSTRGAAGAAVLALLAVLATACGSSLEPSEVSAANGTSRTGGDPGGASDDLPGGAPGDTPGDLPGDVPGDSPGDAPGDIPGDTPADLPGDTPGEGPGDTPGDDPDQPDQPDDPDVPEPGDCDGLVNQDGITDTTITIGNISDITGPVPGLFQQTQDAVKAFVAYFNATSSICGRKLKVLTYDSKTDAGGDQQGYVAACKEVFAAVGSASAFDSGGAATAEGCGLPDLRANSLTAPRNACSTCFGTNSTRSNQFEDIVPETIKRDFGGGDKGAMLYINAGAAADAGKTQAKAGRANGMTYVYETPVDIAEFNYVPYVQTMKEEGVESVQFVANESFFVRLVTTMAQQGYEPEVVMLDPTAYTDGYVKGAGEAGNGTIVFTNFTPFEEAAGNAEMTLYLQWLAQINPSAKPGFFGVFAWSAARLFTEQAIGLGGRLDRESLVAAITQVDDWTDKGLHAPQQVGPKKVNGCWRFLRLQDGVWSPYGGRTYRCSGVTTV